MEFVHKESTERNKMSREQFDMRCKTRANREMVEELDNIIRIYQTKRAAIMREITDDQDRMAKSCGHFRSLKYTHLKTLGFTFMTCLVCGTDIEIESSFIHGGSQIVGVPYYKGTDVVVPEFDDAPFV